jgi:sulfur carrier protein
MQTITVNGTAQEVDDGTTLLAYLQARKTDPSCVVAEINGAIVPKERFPQFTLKSGDIVEVIRFVGGG